jgi:hypothetical protein
MFVEHIAGWRLGSRAERTRLWCVEAETRPTRLSDVMGCRIDIALKKSTVEHARPFQFEWDEWKAEANASKHGVTFELAATVFLDSHLLTVADLDHSETEQRWFSLGLARNGVCYV